MSERTLFLDCSSGVSGDMLVGALLALAADEGEQRLLQALPAIGIDPSLVRTRPTRRGGFEAREFVVAPEPGFATFESLREVVAESALPEEVRADVATLTERMESAELTVHGSDITAVVRPLRGPSAGPPQPEAAEEAGQTPHLHELAGLDTAVDLVAAASLVRLVAPDRIVASPPRLGGGTVTTAHGELTVPPPAVLALLRGLPTAGGRPDDGELTTPTGAALLAHFVDEFGPLPPGVIIGVGVGAGQRELAERPNVLRAVLIAGDQTAGVTGPAAAPAETAELLETNIDDATPEVLAHAAEELRRRGALDVWMTQALMKKGRPGIVLHVLCRPETTADLAEALFAQTTTFGLRVSRVGRLFLEDRWDSETVYGREVRVRLGLLRGRLVTASAEYEDCVAVAAATGVAVGEVLAAAQEQARRRFTVG
jgi:uncharacterized protein (TIGR00299 family) protein